MPTISSSESPSLCFCSFCKQKFSTEEELNHHNEVHVDSELATPFNNPLASISLSADSSSHITDQELKTDNLIKDDLDHEVKTSERQGVVIIQDQSHATTHVGIPVPGRSDGESIPDINVPESFKSTSSIGSMVSGTSQGSGESLPKVSEAPGGTSDETYPREHRYSYYPGKCEPRSPESSPAGEDLMRAYRNKMLVDEDSGDDFGFGGTYIF